VKNSIEKLHMELKTILKPIINANYKNQTFNWDVSTYKMSDIFKSFSTNVFISIKSFL